MTSIIETTCKTLANTGEHDLTEKDYSTRYLGRCKSCYAYLKSTGRQASTDVLMKLWASLRLAEKRGERRGFRLKKPQPNQLPKTARKMSERVLEEMLARSTVCRTPANPPCNQLE
jgi:hypothetical protein